MASAAMSTDLSDLKGHLLHNQNQPVVFHGMITKWEASKWSPTSLASEFGSKTFQFRIGKSQSGVQWETECDYVKATIPDFVSWLSQDKQKGDGPFKAYTKDMHWVYLDYKHMVEVCKKHPHLLKAVDWSVFGFDGRDGTQSTMWLGSPRASTVCHCDTYGCNLVAQIYGRKRWVLFPPSQASSLYPTRLPYEESSIFSTVDTRCPNMMLHPKFKESTPHVVVLEPGDVLYVPKHWWHYVESLETSISINTWIEMESDNEDRLEEAVTVNLVSALASAASDHEFDALINPTEGMLQSTEEQLQHIGNSLARLKSSQNRSNAASTPPGNTSRHDVSCASYSSNNQKMSRSQQVDSVVNHQSSVSGNSEDSQKSSDVSGNAKEESDDDCIPCKRLRTQCDNSSGKSRDLISQICPAISTSSVLPHTYEDYMSVFQDQPDTGQTVEVPSSSDTHSTPIEVSLKDLADCVLQPDVIHLVSQKLKLKFGIASLQ